MTRYLRTRGFTSDQINNEIYPWSSYSYLPLLVLGGLLAEIASFRSVILLGASARIGTRVLLLYGTTVRQQQLMQVLYSFGSAAEVLFFAFAYVITPSSRYGKVTAAVQGTYWAVHVLGAGTGDILLHLGGMSLQSLVVLSSAGIGLSVLWGALLLPSEAPLPQATSGDSHLQSLLLGDGGRERQHSTWSDYQETRHPPSSPPRGPVHSSAAEDRMGTRAWTHQRASSQHNSPAMQPIHSHSSSVTPWELEQGSLNSVGTAAPLAPMSAALCCRRALALALCRTAWVELCCSSEQLYGSTMPQHTPKRAAFGRFKRVFAVLRRVYSSANYAPIVLWWALTGDPPFQNVRNYESSLYDELLPSASTGMCLSARSPS